MSRPCLSPFLRGLTVLGCLFAAFAPVLTFAQSTPPSTETAQPAQPATEAVSGGDEAETQQRPFQPISPNPAVPIPGVRFTPATEEDGKIVIPYLAQYITGIYRVSVGLGAILAAIMIVYGGFRYLLSASLPDIKDGKTIITDAVIGLVVLLSSYLILKTINPKLVEMSPIRVQRVREEVPISTDSFTGNASITGFDVVRGEGGICGAASGGSGQNQTIDGTPFQVLPLRGRYIQGSAPWGKIGYSQNLAQNESNNPCKSERGTSRQTRVNGCSQTFGNGGCGVTSFAEIMAFYGIQNQDPGDATLAQNVKMWNDNQLVSLREHPRGQAIQTQLNARIGQHLYDPIDAARRAIARGDAGSNGQAVTKGTSFMNIEGFEKTTFRDPQLAAQHIRSGHPLVLYCHHCKLKLRSLSDPDHTGGAHFMVIHGVSQDGRWFLIHDVGGGGRAGGKFISADEIRDGRQPGDIEKHSVSLTAIVPNGSTTVRACTNTADPEAATGGSPTSGSNAAAGAGATSGGVTRVGFAYTPPSGDDGWSSPSQLLFPQRLASAFQATTGQRPRVHLYIYIHGQNSHHRTADEGFASGDGYPALISRALSEVAGSKNVIVAAPHYLTTLHGRGTNPYMHRFDIANFYTATVEALERTISGFRRSDIVDVVVSGHSMATCEQENSKILQGVTTRFPVPLLGIVAYDGCLGQSFDRSRGTPAPPAALLMNPDLSGMGVNRTEDNEAGDQTVRRYELVRNQWNLTRRACPAYVENQCPLETPSGPSQRCNACYSTRDNGRQIVSFETHYGHTNSIFHMTRYALRAFYGE